MPDPEAIVPPTAGRLGRDLLPRVRVALLGIALWAFVLLLPAHHLGLLDDVTRGGRTWLMLAFLPLAALAAGVARARTTWLLTAVPLALLPAILSAPELVGERVYGFGGFLVTTGVFGAYLASAARAGVAAPLAGHPTPRRSTSPSARQALLVGLPIVVFGVLCWWAAFDPSVLWQVGPDGALAADRPLGRTLPALVVVASWLVAAMGILVPLAARLRPPRPKAGAEAAPREDS